MSANDQADCSAAEVLSRIQSYLGNGGLFNPEMMEHDKVRDLIIDCREYIDKSLEPDGGNLYQPHMMMVNSGQFWRCKHGVTGFKRGMEWVGCRACETEDPEAFKRWNAPKQQNDQTKPQERTL